MLSYYLLDLTAIDSTFSPLRPSVKAASAVALASTLISQMETNPATGAIGLISVSVLTDTTNTSTPQRKLRRETYTVEPQSNGIGIAASSVDIVTSTVVKITIESMLKTIRCGVSELLGGIGKMVRSLADAELSTYQVGHVI